MIQANPYGFAYILELKPDFRTLKRNKKRSQKHRVFGMMTTAVNMFLRQSINQERLIRAAERMEHTGGTVHELIEVDYD